MAGCEVCFRHCDIEEGKTGFCGGRICRNDRVVSGNYGRITSIALDPIEKKPLRSFLPKSMILSVGSYGCNLRCPFCQNSSISWSEEVNASSRQEGGATITSGGGEADRIHIMSADEVAEMAYRYRNRGNAGVAFTYNEPLIGWEFVRDTARLIHERGMVNVMVTNGTAELSVLEELLPFIDAMNIDIKSFSEECYRDVLGGDLAMVKAFIEEAVKGCHVELTTLIVPGMNDSPGEMAELTGWISGLRDGDGKVIGRNIPLHVSRFFPTFHMTDRPATDVERVYELVDIARLRLDHVWPGNC